MAIIDPDQEARIVTCRKGSCTILGVKELIDTLIYGQEGMDSRALPRMKVNSCYGWVVEIKLTDSTSHFNAVPKNLYGLDIVILMNSGIIKVDHA